MGLQELFSQQQIQARIEEMGKEISDYYREETEPVVCICVLKGAFMFFSDLVRGFEFEPLIDFVRLSSYADKTSPGEKMVFSKDIEVSIEGRNVLIVEDIVDTGHSIDYLYKVMQARKPKSIRIAALFDKYERREKEVQVDFAGFTMPSGFLVGYGLDFAERYRELDAVYELSH